MNTMRGRLVDQKGHEGKKRGKREGQALTRPVVDSDWFCL
jgi:hypothetical protein